MDTIQDGINWVMFQIANNTMEWWAVLALACIVLVWLVGRSARAARF